MKRFSKEFAILKEDLKNKIVQKKNYKTEYTEYWIYKEGETSLIDVFGKKIGDGNFKLKYIIACDYGTNHISKETSKAYFVTGVRFDEEDLRNYLNKTQRG